MAIEVILPYFSCFVKSEEDLKTAIEENYGEIYILSEGGLFLRTNLTHGRSVTTPCTKLPVAMGTLPKVKQDVSSFFPAGKIPITFLKQIVSFFEAVMAENKGAKLEAMIFVIWNPGLGYHIRVPEQTVSGAAVSYNWAGFLGPEDVIVLDMHSHNDMGEYISEVC